MNEENQCFMSPEKRTWKRRIKDRLFPKRYPELPELTEDYKGVVFGISTTYLNWKDRIRVLLTGTIVHEWITATDTKVNKTHTTSYCYIDTPSALLQNRETINQHAKE